MAANDSAPSADSTASTSTENGIRLDAKLKVDTKLESKSTTLKAEAKHAGHLHVYDNGGVTYSEESQAKGSIKAKAGPVSISGGAGIKEAHGAGATYDAQGTHLTVSGDVATWVEGGVEVLGYGYSGKLEHGTRETYEVTVPPPYKVDPATINPFDLSKLPTGTALTLDSTKYDNEESALKFGKQLGGIEIGGEYKHANGVNVTLEKTGDNLVRVTVDAKDTIDDASIIGAKLGVVNPQIGRDGKCDVSTKTTAEFDLSTAAGREAYGRFVVERELPQRDGDGVSKVSTVQQWDVDTQPHVGLKGLAEAKVGLHAHQSYVYTKSGNQADITFTYNVEGAISAKSTYPLDKNGQPDLKQGTQFSITLPHVPLHQAAALRTAFGGRQDSRGLDGEQSVELNFTGEQLMQLRERARDYLNRQQGPDLLRDAEAGKPWGLLAPEQQMLDIAMAKNPREVKDALLVLDGKFVTTNLARLDIALPSPKTPLPGSVAIEPPAAMAAQMASMKETDREALMNTLYRAPPSAVQHPEHDAGAPDAPASTSRYSQNPTDKTPHLNDAGHPDRALYGQAWAGVSQLDVKLGRTPDETTERVAAGLVVASRRDGLERIDHVVLSPDGGRIYAVQGELNSPLKRVADVDTAQAVQTPVAQSSTEWSQTVQTRTHEPAPHAPTMVPGAPPL